MSDPISIIDAEIAELRIRIKTLEDFRRKIASNLKSNEVIVDTDQEGDPEDGDDEYEEISDNQPKRIEETASQIRYWLRENPNSTLEEIRQALQDKIFTFGGKPRYAISLSVYQQAKHGWLIKSDDCTYSVNPNIERKKPIRPKRDLKTRVATRALIRQFIKNNPGKRRSEIADALKSIVDTTGDDASRVVLGIISEMKFASELLVRSDETYWLPDDSELMEESPLRPMPTTDAKIDDESWNFLKLQQQIEEKLDGSDDCRQQHGSSSGNESRAVEG